MVDGSDSALAVGSTFTVTLRLDLVGVGLMRLVRALAFAFSLGSSFSRSLSSPLTSSELLVVERLRLVPE